MKMHAAPYVLPLKLLNVVVNAFLFCLFVRFSRGAYLRGPDNNHIEWVKSTNKRCY